MTYYNDDKQHLIDYLTDINTASRMSADHLAWAADDYANDCANMRRHQDIPMSPGIWWKRRRAAAANQVLPAKG